MKKILLSIIMIFVIIITLIPTMAFAEETKKIEPDYDWYGDGTSTSYEIYDEADLLGFANIVNGKAENIGKDDFELKIVKLMSNIDLTGITWTPIGSSMYDHSYEDRATTKMFAGVFNGNFHTINGLSSENYVALSEDISSGEHSYGLFGYAYGANIHDLYLTNVSIDCRGNAGADGAGVAALVGFYVPHDGRASEIENVHVLSGEVTATNNMGGLIGYFETFDVAKVDVTIKNCSNAATVTAEAREAGGILGLFQNGAEKKGTLRFINCTNTGNIIAKNGASSALAGGILGKDQSYGYKAYEFSLYFENCLNTGNITAYGSENPSDSESHASGIGSSFYTRGAPSVINRCKNTGNITIEGQGEYNFVDGIYAFPASGENGNNMILQNESINTGTLTVKANNYSDQVVIKFDVNGAGEGNVLSQLLPKGTNFTIPTGTALTKEGYTFTGWNAKIEGTGTKYAPGDKLTLNEATTLYAMWEKINNDWSIKAIPSQPYTGKPIKPAIVLFDKDKNVIPSSNYTVTYPSDNECINVGSKKVSVAYNNETVDVYYQIVKTTPKIKITAEQVTNELKININVEADGLDKINVICDDPTIQIIKNGNGSYTAAIPNNDKEYVFTAFHSEDNNYYRGSSSKIVKAKVLTEMVSPTTPTNPNTSDTIITSIILLIISVTGLVFIKKQKTN